MARMIRKQLYLEAEQQKKLSKLAARWGCTEAEVMRKALDRLPDPEASIVARLDEAGLLAHPFDDDDDLVEGEELAELERVQEEWDEAHPEPLGLGEAVLEDRR